MFPRLFVTRSKKTGEDSGTSAGEQELMSLGNLFMAACTGKYFCMRDRSNFSTFRNLWSNGPKECFELSHYTFDEHFDKVVVVASGHFSTPNVQVFDGIE